MNPKTFTALIAIIPSLIALAFSNWSPPVLAIPLLGGVVLLLGMDLLPKGTTFYGVRVTETPGWVPYVGFSLFVGFLGSVAYAIYLAIP